MFITTCVYMHSTYIHKVTVFVCTYVCVHASVFVRTVLCEFMCVFVCVCMHVCSCACVYYICRPVYSIFCIVHTYVNVFTSICFIHVLACVSRGWLLPFACTICFELSFSYVLMQNLVSSSHFSRKSSRVISPSNFLLNSLHLPLNSRISKRAVPS